MRGSRFKLGKKLHSSGVVELVKHLGCSEVDFGNGILQSFLQKRKGPVVLEVPQSDNYRNPDRNVVVIEHQGERLKSVIFRSHQAQSLRGALSSIRIPAMNSVVQHAPASLDGLGPV